MEAKINKNGDLNIKRNGGFRGSSCVNNPQEYCGDWCAGFYEAMPGECLMDGQSNRTQVVQICCDHVFTIVADEREAQDAE